MRVYLDSCCFNRPFDDQTQARVRLETEAKLEVQQRIQANRLELVWSYMLDYENQANPFVERREAISRWKSLAIIDVVAGDELLNQAKEILQRTLRAKDALHVACAIAAGCEIFLTTDDLVVKKTRDLDRIRVMNPTQFVIEVGP